MNTEQSERERATHFAQQLEAMLPEAKKVEVIRATRTDVDGGRRCFHTVTASVDGLEVTAVNANYALALGEVAATYRRLAEKGSEAEPLSVWGSCAESVWDSCAAICSPYAAPALAQPANGGAR
jgi:hypothetical protein